MYSFEGSKICDLVNRRMVSVCLLSVIQSKLMVRFCDNSKFGVPAKKQEHTNRLEQFYSNVVFTPKQNTFVATSPKNVASRVIDKNTKNSAYGTIISQILFL